MPEKATKRTPITEPMLIRKGKEWQVCYQARGTINYERVTAWVYGPDSVFFCRVGEQNEIIMLPQKDMHFRGAFPFLVDRIAPDGVPMEILGGSMDAGAARAMFNHLLPNYSRGLRMMHGARLMFLQDEEKANSTPRQQEPAGYDP